MDCDMRPIDRRPPEVVMRLARMGSFYQTRLSFMRSLLRRLKSENWRYKRKLWAIDENGFGRAVYSVYGPERAYSPRTTPSLLGSAPPISRPFLI